MKLAEWKPEKPVLEGGPLAPVLMCSGVGWPVCLLGKWRELFKQIRSLVAHKERLYYELLRFLETLNILLFVFVANPCLAPCIRHKEGQRIKDTGPCWTLFSTYLVPSSHSLACLSVPFLLLPLWLNSLTFLHPCASTHLYVSISACFKRLRSNVTSPVKLCQIPQLAGKSLLFEFPHQF